MQELFNWISDFFTSGIYKLITDSYASLIEWWLLSKLKWALWLLGFAWNIAQSLLANLGISSALSAAWGSLDSAVLQSLMFFRVPDVVNIMLSAFSTRFVLRFIPLSF